MDNFDISKTGKIILFYIIMIPLSVMIAFLIYGMFFDSTSPQEYYLKEHRQFKLNSTIIQIYRDKKNHNNQTLVFRSDTLITLPPAWENNFKIGDSISKKSKSLKIEHYRGRKLLEVLNYDDVL